MAKVHFCRGRYAKVEMFKSKDVDKAMVPVKMWIVQVKMRKGDIDERERERKRDQVKMDEHVDSSATSLILTSKMQNMFEKMENLSAEVGS